MSILIEIGPSINYHCRNSGSGFFIYCHIKPLLSQPYSRDLSRPLPKSNRIALNTRTHSRVTNHSRNTLKLSPERARAVKNGMSDFRTAVKQNEQNYVPTLDEKTHYTYIRVEREREREYYYFLLY